MQDKTKQLVLDAFLLMLRPVVRILLRYGIGYREFAEVTKTAFVDVASSDFGIRGRPTNISRVAVMTGLTRKEVRRLRDKVSEGDSAIRVKSTPLLDVLHHWHAQPEFTDSDGRPLPLPFSGGEKSFNDLVRRFGGDIPAGAMRTEMKSVGVIREDESGSLCVIQRTFIPDTDHENLVTLLVHSAYPLLSNIEHNTSPDRDNDRWAHRVAFTQSLRSRDTKQLRRIAKDRIADFSETIDDILIAYESLQDDREKEDDNNVVSVGIFYFEEHDENASYEW